jgi:mono/diheme cytochrome c family protein
MRRWLSPLVLLVCVSGAVFALAQAHLFAPAAIATAGPVALGDVYQGETVFQQTCASCHGAGGAGGGIGPKLQGSGVTPATIQARIRAGAGVMPAALVSGRDEADVVAYVASIAAP